MGYKEVFKRVCGNDIKRGGGYAQNSDAAADIGIQKYRYSHETHETIEADHIPHTEYGVQTACSNGNERRKNKACGCKKTGYLRADAAHRIFPGSGSVPVPLRNPRKKQDEKCGCQYTAGVIENRAGRIQHGTAEIAQPVIHGIDFRGGQMG